MRAIALHLLVSCMRPSIDAMHTMLREGFLIGPQGHLCMRMDANVSVYHPDFWTSSVTAAAGSGQRVVPACLQACVGDISAGAKAVAILHAYGKGSREAALQSGGVDDPPSFFRWGRMCLRLLSSVAVPEACRIFTAVYRNLCQQLDQCLVTWKQLMRPQEVILL